MWAQGPAVVRPLDGMHDAEHAGHTEVGSESCKTVSAILYDFFPSKWMRCGYFKFKNITALFATKGQLNCYKK